MLGEHFYNETYKRAITAFGTMFNNITIQREYKDGSTKTIPVPVSFGPREKWLELSQKKQQQFAQSLPKISFDAVTMSYDVNRKLITNNMIRNTRITNAGTVVDTNMVPTPYNLALTMVVITKHLDDAWQIIEQILPFFTPAYTLKIKDSSSIENEVHMPITLQATSWADDYQGPADVNRNIEFTLEFEAKINFYGPATKGNNGIILNVDDASTIDFPAPEGIFNDR